MSGRVSRHSSPVEGQLLAFGRPFAYGIARSVSRVSKGVRAEKFRKVRTADSKRLGAASVLTVARQSGLNVDSMCAGTVDSRKRIVSRNG